MVDSAEHKFHLPSRSIPVLLGDEDSFCSISQDVCNWLQDLDVRACVIGVVFPELRMLSPKAGALGPGLLQPMLSNREDPMLMQTFLCSSQHILMRGQHIS